MTNDVRVPIPADGWEPDDQQPLMRKAVAELMSQYGWSERVAASVMLTVTTAVKLAPKPKR